MNDILINVVFLICFFVVYLFGFHDGCKYSKESQEKLEELLKRNKGEE